ncbi:MAG: sulfatase [Saprospiraceae bacterium]|nr:sulfatase [Saprospiraceae bacterium]
MRISPRDLIAPFLIMHQSLSSSKWRLVIRCLLLLWIHQASAQPDQSISSIDEDAAFSNPVSEGWTSGPGQASTNTHLDTIGIIPAGVRANRRLTGTRIHNLPPNIVLLFVDDLGWNDLGYRNKKFHTPNIDALRAQGMEFTRAYVSTPTCSPSRASLLTGKEAVRLQMVRHITQEDEFGRNSKKYNYWPTDPANNPSINWLPLEEKTYAEMLKEAGYQTMFIGKWHLGHEPYHPQKQGFDQTYGVSNFGHPRSYYPPYFTLGNPLQQVADSVYLTEHLTEKAQDYIRSFDQQKPFLLSFWYYNVHGPHVGNKKWLTKYRSEGLRGKEAEYAAMVSSIDDSVGKIRKTLSEQALDKRTIVLFLSDQGGLFDNAPLAGGKRGGNALGEGGARVPFLMHYPGVTDSGASMNTPIQTIDVYPTLYEIANGHPCKDQDINGTSLLPLLSGKETQPRNLFFYRSYEDQYAAIITNEWKLIKYRSGKYEMYNVVADPSESNNLIGQRLPQEKKLISELTKWEEEVSK